MTTVENIGDHLAYTCQCGSVTFCLLRSGNVECNKCQDRPGLSWAHPEPQSAPEPDPDAWRIKWIYDCLFYSPLDSGV